MSECSNPPAVPKKPAPYDYRDYRASQPTTAFLRDYYADYDERGRVAVAELQERALRVAKALLGRLNADSRSRISVQDAETLYWALRDKINVYRQTGVDGEDDMDMVDEFNRLAQQGTKSLPAGQYADLARFVLEELAN